MLTMIIGGSNFLPETENYSLKELVRNNCNCGNFVKDCENCEIEKNVTLAFKEWLIKQRVIAEESYAKYDALVIQNLIDRVDNV